MQVNYADYFAALGFTETFYDPVKNEFNTQAIINRIQEIQDKWKTKYPNFNFRTDQLRFDNLVNFDLSFVVEIQGLNMDAK